MHVYRASAIQSLSWCRPGERDVSKVTESGGHRAPGAQQTGKLVSGKEGKAIATNQSCDKEGNCVPSPSCESKETYDDVMGKPFRIATWA